VSAFCRTHYGGVLTAAGRWTEADLALTEAIGLWGLGERSRLRAGAVVRLAGLRVRQGRWAEAEQLLADPFVHPNGTAPRRDLCWPPWSTCIWPRAAPVRRRGRPRH
jgi:hypothetical protein